MSAIRNEQDKQDRAATQQRDADPAVKKIDGARAALEGEIRDLVRRNVSPLRPAEPNPNAPAAAASPARRDGEFTAEPSSPHVNALIKQVSGASIEEIDRVVKELNSVRELLRSEGDRVTREIAGFASLNHAAMTAMRVIADSVTEWKDGAQLRSRDS